MAGDGARDHGGGGPGAARLCRVDCALVGFGLLVVAAIGGVCINVLFHRRRLPLPIQVMLVHALTAAMGLLLLLVSLYAPSQVQ